MQKGNKNVSFFPTAIPLGETRPITIDTTATGKPDVPCKLFAKGPTSPYIEIPTKKTKEGYEAEFKPEQSGPNDVKVLLAEKEVTKTPFVVNVVAEFDEKNVEIKGLESRKLYDWNVIFMADGEDGSLKEYVYNKHGSL